MTLRLILMRHAKSSWDDPALDDHDRPLNNRGVRSANAIGEWLRRHKYVPDVVLCSSAARTHQTWQHVGPFLDPEPVLHILPGLYLASPDTMLKMLSACHAPVVMMIGHNPGTASFANGLISALPDHPRFSQFPTAATAVIDFQLTDWPDVQQGTGKVADFIVPRELL